MNVRVNVRAELRGAPVLAVLAMLTCTDVAIAQDSTRNTTRESRTMQGQEGYLTTADGVRLHVEAVGTGPKKLIIPNAIYMRDDFKRLAPGRTLVFYDLRNRGRSDTVTDGRKLQRGVHQDVDDLEAVRRHFNIDQMDVLGHSYLGAMVALYAIRYPARVDRLVQMSPPPPDFSQQIPAHLTGNDAVSAQVFAALGKLQQGNAGLDPIAACRRAWDVLRPLYVADPANAARLGHWGYCEHANERNMLTHWNANILPSLRSLVLTTDEYAQARMPVLTIHGTKDRSAPYGGGREWARRLPNARLITVDNVGHVPYVEAPEQVYDSIETFLAGDWPASARKVRALDPKQDTSALP